MTAGHTRDSQMADAEERRHPPGCDCVRCTGFPKGHALSLKHGAYATVRLGGRVVELADEIRPLVPGYTPSDEAAVRVLCLALARLEASAAAIEEASPEELARLRQDERGWANTVRRYLNDLGLTPLARAKLGLDVVRIRATEEGLDEVRQRGAEILERREREGRDRG